MGTSVGSLYYDLDIDDKNLKPKLDDADKGVKQLGDNATDSFDKFQKGAKAAAIGLGVVGAGLTLYSKNALDFTTDLVKSSKALGTQIGVSTTEASRLVAAFGRMGIEASSASQMFGIFSKQISGATENAEKNKIAQAGLAIQIKETQKKLDDSTGSLAQQQAALQQQIGATKIAITQTTEQINKHGDASGQLTNKVQGLQIKLSDLQHQYDDTKSSTGGAALETQKLQNQMASLKQQMDSTTSGFDKLGISVKDNAGKQKDFNTLLFEVADKFKTMPNGVDKTTIAMELFGRSGKDMIKVLNLGSQGIQDLEKQSDRLGLTLNATTIGAIAKMVEQQKILKQETDAMKIAVGTATAPVLTEFTSKLNSLVMTLLNAKGPFRDITIDVLAFGGPIAGAASGLLAFIANVDQAKGALMALGNGFMGMIGLLQTPWVLAFIAAGFAVGVVTNYLFNQQSQSERLKLAQDNLTATVNQLKTAQDNLATAHLNEQGAALQVERAQRAYTDAVAQYGPKSLEARQAAYDLATAQDRHRDATNQVKDALQKVSDKEKEVAKNRDLINHLREVKDEADNVQRSADGAVISLNQLGIKASQTKTQGVKIDLSPLLKRAGGGPVESGRQYLTGEQGPELFVPNHSGTIIPAGMTKKIMQGQTQQGESSTRFGDTVVNIGSIHNDQDEAYVLRRLDRNQQLQGMGISPA